MSYITTATGKHFDPINPEEELLDINDIAHSLSLICRANGHIKHFYSVAQHSIACAKEATARGYERDIILFCLLHDASEAYLSDVTRPVKKDLSYYLDTEERLQNLIWKHFAGRVPNGDDRKLIFEIDDQMLSKEFHELMPEDIDDSYLKLVSDVRCEERRPEEVREEFVSMFGEYLGK